MINTLKESFENVGDLVGYRVSEVANALDGVAQIWIRPDYQPKVTETVITIGSNVVEGSLTVPQMSAEEPTIDQKIEETNLPNDAFAEQAQLLQTAQRDIALAHQQYKIMTPQVPNDN